MSRQLAGTPATFVGTVTTAVTGIQIVNPISKRPSFARRVVIHNTGTTNIMHVYFAGSPNPVSIGVTGFAEFEGPIAWLGIQAAVAGTTYEVFASVA